MKFADPMEETYSRFRMSLIRELGAKDLDASAQCRWVAEQLAAWLDVPAHSRWAQRTPADHGLTVMQEIHAEVQWWHDKANRIDQKTRP